MPIIYEVDKQGFRCSPSRVITQAHWDKIKRCFPNTNLREETKTPDTFSKIELLPIAEPVIIPVIEEKPIETTKTAIPKAEKNKGRNKLK